MPEPTKETVPAALPPKADQASAPQDALKRDTTRIDLSSRTPPAPVRRSPPSFPPSSSTAGSTAEPPVISLRRPPVSPPSVSTSSALLQPLPKPAGPAAAPESSTATPATPRPEGGNENGAAVQSASSLQPGPKKETARIHFLPRPAGGGPSINMTKTQPLLVRPATTMQPAPIVVTPGPLYAFELIPRSFCWTLLGISALIFLIQIWNYVVS
ncbi:MAG: hypothetical protein QOF24_2204 [Verrucomicrobiota bacterium]|jgi:hypothetical protein